MSPDERPAADVGDAAATAGPAEGAVSSPAPGNALLPLTDRIYHVARIAMATVLLVMYTGGIFKFSTAEGDQHAVFVAGLALYIAVGIFALVARIAIRQPPHRVLWEVLLPDLVAAGMLVASTGGYHDPFYPWMLGLAIAYAATMRRRQAWVVAALAACTYMVAHFVGHGAMHNVDDFLLLTFKAAGLIFTGVVVADAMQRQTDRELRLKDSQADVLDLNDRLSRRLAELHAVSEITEVIHSTLDFDRVGPLVLDILSKVIDMPAIALFVIDKDKDETVFSASAGVAPNVARTYTDAYMLGSDNDAGDGENMFACTTVMDHKRLMVVFCATTDQLDAMGAEDRLVLQAVASELVVAVENSQLYKLTKRLSITDELTGLFNYRYLQQRLDDEIERARRYGRSLSMLMLDADDFKKYNDTHGHVAGDIALAEIGTVLHAAVREIDVVCRYGGEEFAVLLPETDAEGAFVVAEKVREAVASHSFLDADGNRGVRLTVSIGLATYPASAADREELLRQADDALYNAKTTGRDRVRAPSGVVMKIGADDAATDGARRVAKDGSS